MKLYSIAIISSLFLSVQTQGQLPSLVTNSPFGTVESTNAETSESLLQQQSFNSYTLHGYFTWKSTTQFILENKNTKKTIWIPRDAAKEQIEIVNWDKASKSLVINVNGHQTSLTIQETKKVSLKEEASLSEDSPTSNNYAPASVLRRPRKKLD